MERAWHPYMAVLGRVPELKGYHDTGRHPEALQVPGLLIFRFDAPLFFANAEVFREALQRQVAVAPAARRVVVAAEPITDIDSTAADMLAGLMDDFEKRGISLAFAEMKGPVKDSLKRYGMFDRVGENHFHPTIGAAVHAYVADFAIDWVDWEDLEVETAARQLPADG
jgi:MFS superfamily sulfate permease-like transporter